MSQHSFLVLAILSACLQAHNYFSQFVGWIVNLIQVGGSLLPYKLLRSSCDCKDPLDFLPISCIRKHVKLF